MVMVRVFGWLVLLGRSEPHRLEASGGLTLGTARAYAETGVDYLAVGAITHSSPALDLGMDLTTPAQGGRA